MVAKSRHRVKNVQNREKTFRIKKKILEYRKIFQGQKQNYEIQKKNQNREKYFEIEKNISESRKLFQNQGKYLRIEKYFVTRVEKKP